MPDFWLLPDGELIKVPPRVEHADIAAEEGLTLAEAYDQGWIRIVGVTNLWWDFEVWDVTDDRTLELIESFLYDNPPSQTARRLAGVETHLPANRYIPLYKEDAELLGIKDALRVGLERELVMPGRGRPELGRRRGKHGA